MTYTAIFPDTKTVFSYIGTINRPEETAEETDASGIPETGAGSKLADWLDSTRIVTTTGTTVIPAGKVFQADRLLVKFRLASEYADRFVLLRGLLDFSRPKGIVLSSDRTERTFEIEVAEHQAEPVITYLETIFGELIREIRFKSLLKEIVRFENRIRLEQAKLYGKLKAST